MIAICHFFATAVVLWVSSHKPFSLFQPVRIPFFQLLPLSAFFTGFLILGNFSLSLNSVGFYQLAKIMTLPTVVLLNFLLFRKTISYTMLFAVAMICFGVALTISQPAVGNPVGSIVAVAAFIVTAMYQIWIGKKISDLKVSAPQLLMNQAPVSILLLAVLAPFVDTMPDLSTIEPSVLWMLFWSSIIASVLNLSQFMIIGRTSAFTFNIVSNFKNIIIIALGWYVEQRVPSGRDLVGITLTLGGVWAYARLAQ
jgi:solute carrier family 35 protein E3